MAAQFLRLKLRLLGNAFRRSPWQLVGMLLGLLYGASSGIVAISGLISLRLVEAPVADAIVTVFGGIIVLGFVILPLAFGVDDVMDPRKLALLGIPTTTLARNLALTSLIGVPAVVLTLVALAQVVTWSRGPLPLLFALISVVLLVCTCMLLSRVVTSTAGFLLSTRRARDISGLVGFLVLVALVPVVFLLLRVDWANDGYRVLQGVASVVGWTPLGAVWSAPGDAATGDIGAAVLKLLIAIATVVLLWFAWRALVFAMTTSSQRLAHVRTYRGLGWFRLFPATAAGAVAARSATYWVRDARYHVSLIVVPVVPLLMMVPLAVVGVPPNVLALFPVPIMALFLGWSVHNDVAYDSTAIWLHVASSVPGKADRIGRLTPALLLGVPVIVLAAFITAPLFGDDAILPALIGLGLCILFAGLGLASVTSAQFPYPAVRPGDSPFAQPQAVGTASSLIQSFSFFFTAALSAPVAWLAWLTLIEGSKWALPTLGLGIALGLVYLAIGVWGGGRIFTRRGPAILAFSMRN